VKSVTPTWLEVIAESNTDIRRNRGAGKTALMEGRRMHIILAPGVAQKAGVAQKSKPKEAQDAKVKDA